MAIRPDTDPAKAAPRPGSSKGELEQYGVWVKAEPQDIVEEATLPHTGDFDADLPGTNPVTEESFLSEDEERLLGSFDAEFEEPGTAGPDAGSPVGETALPDIEDMPPMDEGLLQADSPVPAEDIEELGASTIDIELEDIESVPTASAVPPSSYAQRAAPSGGDMEDVSAEFLDEKDAAPSPASTTPGPGAADDVTAQFLDVEEIIPPSIPPEATPDFEPIDIDLQFDETLPSPGAPQSAPSKAAGDSGFEEVTEFDDFLSDAPAAAPSPSPRGPRFDDVAAVERDLYQDAAKPASPKHDLSTEILLKIADELSSIRGELVSLKTQLGSLREAVPAAPAAEPEMAAESEAEASGGFFDDEEDETIALTGDELDNILNTADFTEEVAETEVPEDLVGAADLEINAEPTDMSLLDENLLPEDGDYSKPAAEPAIEEVTISGDTISTSPAEPEPVELSDLDLVAEHGARPMTTAPEDSSYLEADAELELVEAPIRETPLVEPDLSDFDLETEELDLSPEIAEELPVVESGEDLSLSIDLGSEFGPSDAPAELEPLEPVAEVEDASFAEISLHDEGQATEAEEVGGLEDTGGLEELDGGEEADLLAERIDRSTVKPAEPVSLHPDNISMSLDDRFFVGDKAESEMRLETGDEIVLSEEAPAEAAPAIAPAPKSSGPAKAAMVAKEAEESPADSERLKSEIRSVLAYLDKLLDSLPEDKIEEFARSKYFDTYKRLFEELGLV